MSTGISLPVRLDSLGNTVLDTDEIQLEKVIRLGLLGCLNANPFQQDLGLPPKIFQLPGVQAVKSYIRDFFDSLQAEGRAKLDTLSFGDVKDGEVDVTIIYIDLENNQKRELRL